MNLKNKIEKELTIMFTDMVGYSRLVNTDQTKALSLLEEFNAINFSNIKKYNGTVIKLIGDAVFAEFNSSYDATRAAIDMQKDIQQRNKLSKKSDFFSMRVGLHKGKVIVKDNDLFGHTVNIGSRIEGIAPIGGIAISEETYKEIEDKKDIQSRKIGFIKLKNIKYPQAIYKIYLDAKDFNSETQSSLVKSMEERGVVLTDKNTVQKDIHPIALLYLDNIGNQEEDFFVYSITENLINDLKKIENIRIPSINNVQQFKQTDLPDSEIGRRLKVDKIIKGTIIKNKDKCQVHLEMIDLIKGESIWEHKWNGNSSYTNNLNGEMITGILERLNIEIPDYIKQYFTLNKTENASAYDNYLKGKTIIDLSKKPEDFKKSEKLLKNAIELDPNFIEPYAYLGTLYKWMYQFEEAEDILEEGQEIAKDTHNNPGLAAIYMHFGLMYHHWGKFEKSLIYLEKSLEIQSDLHDKFEEAKISQSIGNFYSHKTPKQDMEKAKKYLDNSIKIYEELEEDYAIANAYATFSVFYKNMNKFSESSKYAIDALAKYRSLSMTFNEYRIICVLADTFMKLGLYDLAEKYIKDTQMIVEDFDDYYIMGRLCYISSQVNLSKNEFDEAIEDLEESIENYQLAEKNERILSSSLELVQIYFNQNNMKKVKRYLKKIKRLVRKQKNTNHELEYKIFEEYLSIKENDSNIDKLDDLFNQLDENISLEKGYETWWHLACCYHEIGEDKKAKSIASKCLKIIQDIAKEISNPDHQKSFLQSNLLHKQIIKYC